MFRYFIYCSTVHVVSINVLCQYVFPAITIGKQFLLQHGQTERGARRPGAFRTNLIVQELLVGLGGVLKVWPLTTQQIRATALASHRMLLLISPDNSGNKVFGSEHARGPGSCTEDTLLSSMHSSLSALYNCCLSYTALSQCLQHYPPRQWRLRGKPLGSTRRKYTLSCQCRICIDSQIKSWITTGEKIWEALTSVHQSLCAFQSGSSGDEQQLHRGRAAPGGTTTVICTWLGLDGDCLCWADCFAKLHSTTRISEEHTQKTNLR